MAAPSFRVTEILAALHDAGVRYVAVGGFAVILHGHLRTTRDLDLVLDLDTENCRRGLEALAGIGLQPRLPVALGDFADPDIRKDWVDQRNMQVFQLWDPENPIRSVDLFVREPILFEDLWHHSQVSEIFDTPIRIASIDHLIEMKRQAGRDRDKLDIQALQELKGHEPGKD